MAILTPSSTQATLRRCSRSQEKVIPVAHQAGLQEGRISTAVVRTEAAPLPHLPDTPMAVGARANKPLHARPATHVAPRVSEVGINVRHRRYARFGRETREGAPIRLQAADAEVGWPT